MFFDLFGNADKNGDGKVDIWETAEQLYAYDCTMGTNISGFCPENDEKSTDDYDIEDESDKLYDNEYFGDDEDYDEFDDEFEDEDEDEFDDEFSDEFDDDFDY